MPSRRMENATVISRLQCIEDFKYLPDHAGKLKFDDAVGPENI
jgi:hypothetical protein